MWLSVVLLLICTVQGAPSVQNDTPTDFNCTALEELCTERTSYWLTGDDFVDNLPWPLTAHDISQYSSLIQEYCRNAKESGSCMLDMTSKCRHMLSDNDVMLQTLKQGLRTQDEHVRHNRFRG